MIINDNINIGLIPENCSIVAVKDESLKLQARIGHVLITGGYYNGNILDQAIGVVFFEEVDKGLKLLKAVVQNEFNPIQVARMMHESVIIKNQQGKQCLLVIGGKSETNKNWLQSSELINIEA